MSLAKFILSGLLIGAIEFVKSTEGQQKCETPSGSIGSCIAFESCESIYNADNWYTPNDFELIEKSWCPTLNGIRHICCPPSLLRLLQPIIPQPVTIQPHQPDQTTDLQSVTITNDILSEPNVNQQDFLKTCGKSSTFRISGGNYTEPFEYPWMVMIRTLESDNTFLSKCSGTIISKRYVLTAAHCLRGVQGSFKIHSVVLGEHNTATNPDCIDGECADEIQVIPVNKTILHPNFSTLTAKNDIGLIRLQWDAKFSDSVMPICLPFTKESQNLELKRIIITGWGGSIERGPQSNVLLSAILDVTPNTECSIIFRRVYGDRLTIDSNSMCAYGGKSDTCGGDSGGPAIFHASAQYGPRYFQYGIVSAGAYKCGDNNGVPGFYTRVTSYLNWILDNIS